MFIYWIGFQLLIVVVIIPGQTESQRANTLPYYTDSQPFYLAPEVKMYPIHTQGVKILSPVNMWVVSSSSYVPTRLYPNAFMCVSNPRTPISDIDDRVPHTQEAGQSYHVYDSLTSLHRKTWKPLWHFTTQSL